MNEGPPSNIEASNNFLSKHKTVKWRPKTITKNKLRMNMKAVLDPKFRRDEVTPIEDSSIECVEKFNSNCRRH